MEPQEIFDAVAKHLFKQGKRAFDGNTCKYRGATGLTCAVGCLIPDDMYDKRMEGVRVLGLVLPEFKVPEYFNRNKWLLNDLQLLHDTAVNWTCTQAMLYALASLARIHMLSMSVVNTLAFTDR